MKLKLIGADRYFVRAVSKDPILHGTVIDVDDAVGQSLLDETYTDSANNEKRYFEVSNTETSEDAQLPAAGKPATVRRAGSRAKEQA